jgi:hypothetical protein
MLSTTQANYWYAHGMSELKAVSNQSNNSPFIDLSTITLKVGWYRFGLVASDDVTFQSFSGSAWRGLFGHALRKTVCVTKMPDCGGCLLIESCAYAYLFETAPHATADRMRRYSTIPHPFVIKNSPTDQTIKSGGQFDFEILLIGKANQYLAYLIQTFLQAGKIGIGRNKSKFDLLNVNYRHDLLGENWSPIWSAKLERLQKAPPTSLVAPDLGPNKTVRITFKTPIRIVEKGKLIAANRLKFSHIYKSLSRRISMLAYFHEGNDFNIDYKTSLAMAEQVQTQREVLKPVNWKRYSSRQNKRISVDGVIGEMEFDLTNFESLWPMLWLGQFTHVGKATSMGLGEYKIETLASLSNK